MIIDFCLARHQVHQGAAHDLALFNWITYLLSLEHQRQEEIEKAQDCPFPMSWKDYWHCYANEVMGHLIARMF